LHEGRKCDLWQIVCFRPWEILPSFDGQGIQEVLSYRCITVPQALRELQSLS
jgi:hypothetical protein